MAETNIKTTTLALATVSLSAVFIVAGLIGAFWNNTELRDVCEFGYCIPCGGVDGPVCPDDPQQLPVCCELAGPCVSVADASECPPEKILANCDNGQTQTDGTVECYDPE